MHGLIFVSLQKFTEKKISALAWEEVSHLSFDCNHNYDDKSFNEMIKKLSSSANVSEDVFLEQFGEYLFSELIKVYKHWVMTEWDSLEFIMNVEKVMHTVARATAKSVDNTPYPPIVLIDRIGPNEIQIKYLSFRKLCPMAKGLLLGVGKHYGEALEINELVCSKKGSDYCLFKVTRHPKACNS